MAALPPGANELLDSQRRHAAVAKRPESQRLMVNLAKPPDLPLAEPVSRTGCSIAALKVAAHRAMRHSRSRLRVGSRGRADG